MKKGTKRLELSRETLWTLQEIRLTRTAGAGLETTQPTNLPYDQPSYCDCPSVDCTPSFCGNSCSCG